MQAGYFACTYLMGTASHYWEIYSTKYAQPGDGLCEVACRGLIT